MSLLFLFFTLLCNCDTQKKAAKMKRYRVFNRKANEIVMFAVVGVKEDGSEISEEGFQRSECWIEYDDNLES